MFGSGALNLFVKAVSSKVESDKKDSEIEDIKVSYEESLKAVEVAEEEQNRARQAFENELHSAKREQESKVREQRMHLLLFCFCTQRC